MKYIVLSLFISISCTSFSQEKSSLSLDSYKRHKLSSFLKRSALATTGVGCLGVSSLAGCIAWCFYTDSEEDYSSKAQKNINIFIRGFGSLSAVSLWAGLKLIHNSIKDSKCLYIKTESKNSSGS